MTQTWWILISVASAAFFAGACVAHIMCRPGRGGAIGESRPRPSCAPAAALAAIMMGGLLLRVVLAACTTGHPTDIGTFGAWADHASQGLLAFYDPGYFADYPPGYIYVLWGIGKLRAMLDLNFDSPAFMLLLKSPAILADLIAVWVIYRLARRWSAGVAVVLAGLYAFNPAVIVDSAAWGQVDSVLTLFILLGLALLESHPGISGACFAAGLLVKPQALIFIPAALLWLGVAVLRDAMLRRRTSKHASPNSVEAWHPKSGEAWHVDKAPTEGQPAAKAVNSLLAFTAAGAAMFALGVLPFVLREGPWWVVGKYGGTLASYPYASLNAFNLFALLGANAVEMSQTFGPLSYATWGTIFLLAVAAFAVVVALRGRGSSVPWYLGAFLCVSVFVLSAKMHERYMFPALALTLGLLAVSRSRVVLWLFAALSITQFINISQVLALSLTGTYYVPRLDSTMLAVSAVNVALWLALTVWGVVRYIARK